MRRVLFNAAAAVSLLIFLAAGVTWVVNRGLRVPIDSRVDLTDSLRVYLWSGEKRGFSPQGPHVGAMILYYYRTMEAGETAMGPAPTAKLTPARDYSMLGASISIGYVATAQQRGSPRVLVERWAVQLKAVMPYWLIMLAAAPLPLLWVWRYCRRPGVGCCPTCGYDLRASPDGCPECGAGRNAAA